MVHIAHQYEQSSGSVSSLPDSARPLPVSTLTIKLRPEEAALFLWAIIPYFTLKWSTFLPSFHNPGSGCVILMVW